MSDVRSENKMKSQDFVSDLTDAARENPVSAALIGMGVLWLFAGGAKTSLFGQGTSLLGTIGHGAQKIAHVASSGAEQITNAMVTGANTAADAFSDAADKTRDAASVVGTTLSEAGTKATDLASSAYHGAIRTVAGDSRKAGDYAPRNESNSAWSSMQKSLSSAFARQPLLLAALGVGIGAGLAAAIPKTEFENNLVGEASDALKDQAQEFLATKTEKAKSVASKALGEAEAAGITPAAAGEVLRGVVDQVVQVAKTAGGSLSGQLAQALNTETSKKS